MIELYIIKSILIYNIYNKYNYILEERFLEEESEELSLIYKAIVDFYKKNPSADIGSVDVLEQTFHACYPTLPKKKRELISPIFERLRGIVLDQNLIGEYFSKLRKKYSYRELAVAALDASQGKEAGEEKVKELYERGIGDFSLSDDYSHPLWSRGVSFIDGPESKDVSWSLSFRSKTLQRSIGPLRQGDFGLVVARPEVGKTAFAVDCAAHMVEQVPNRAVYLGNEERARMVYARIISSFLGIPKKELRQDLAVEAYEKVFKDRLILLHEVNLHYRELYAFLREAKPELIIIDQLDKMKGFDDDRKDLELGAIYEWFRGIASEFGVVIGLSQASEGAEGKRWLEQNDIANSKTAKPAEMDWILGIGKTHESALEKIRHFHIIKNKLEGDSNTLEEYRHGKFDMLIEPTISRYLDVMKWS